ncbi:metalloprotease [Escherichia coli]|nr:metalloprotease [Escherichia coli]
MKLRALVVAISVATVLHGCQKLAPNGPISLGTEAFQAYTLIDCQG